YLLLIYGAVALICFYSFGIKTMTDSYRYLNYSSNLAHGFYIEPHNFWYFGYVVFLYTLKLFSQEYLAIIIIQYFFGYLAILAIYETGILLFNNKTRALFSA